MAAVADTSQQALVVECGAVLKTDLRTEAVFALLRKHPLLLFVLPVQLAKGSASFTRWLADRAELDFATLPWRTGFIEDLRKQREEGRTLRLAAGPAGDLARAAAEHLKLFDEVVPGRATADHVNASAGWSVRLRALRPAHWLKNLLAFVPVLGLHRVDDPALFGKSLAAFAALSCCASSGYLFNDLLDLNADRHHPGKRLRPFASGDLPLSYGLIATPLLLVAGCSIAAAASPLLVAAVLGYLAMSLFYTLQVKKIAIFDVLFLAGLYTLRIVAGSAATGIWLSHWLLAFSTFLFFSLALVKRYSELMVMRRANGKGAKVRAYEQSDAELLAAMGTASGYLAVLVLALYIATDKARGLYVHRELLGCLCPLLLYWVSHVWLSAHRGRITDDPVVFAIKDRTSLILVASMIVTLAVAL